MKRGICLLALVLGVAGGALAGCGGDEETSEVTPVTAPPLTVPEDETSTALDETLTTTDGTETTQTTAVEEEAGAGATPGPESGGVSPSPAPQGGDDTPENDTPPPQNSPAERFEKFCQDNPGAC